MFKPTLLEMIEIIKNQPWRREHGKIKKKKRKNGYEKHIDGKNELSPTKISIIANYHFLG
jgi:hypothetical protein